MPPQQPLCFSLLHHGQSLPSPGVESLGEDGEEKSGCPEEKNNAISEKWCSASQRVGTRLEMGGNRCRMGTLVRSYLWITTYTCLHRSSYPFTLSSVVCMSVQTSGWGQTGIVFIPDTSGIVNTIDSLWPLKKFIDSLIPTDLSADSIQLRNRDRSWRNLAYSDHSELQIRDAPSSWSLYPLHSSSRPFLHLMPWVTKWLTGMKLIREAY